MRILRPLILLVVFSSLQATSVTASAEGASCVSPPVGCRITSPFGYRIFKGVHDSHRGLDFGCPIGTPVKSVENGVVIASYFDAQTGAGNMVKVQSPNGRVTKYFHNSRLMFDSPGKKVGVGTLIAYSGNTGGSKTGKAMTGPHLHFEMWDNGVPVNPASRICGAAGAADGGVLDGGTDFPHDDDHHAKVEGTESGPAYLDGLEGSLYGILSDVIGSRALNPDYPRQLSTLSEPRLYAEIAYLRAISLQISSYKLKAKERREAKQAALQSLKVREVMAADLQIQHQRASQSAGSSK